MSESTQLMAGKRGLIMGVANKNSIAWGIAQICADHGAELAFTYQGDALKKRVVPLAESVNSNIILPCDVTDAASIDAVFADLEKNWGKIDFLVHAIAYADKDELRGRYVDTSPENYQNSLHISCYSLTAIAQRAEKIMPDGGSIITLSYLGANRVLPHYNVMGVAKAALEASVRYLANDLGPQKIRVNSISAGPIKTLAASGVGDFRNMLTWTEENAPLRRNVSKEDVAGSALYFLSDLSAGVTGENHFVDGGFNIISMKAINDGVD